MLRLKGGGRFYCGAAPMGFRSRGGRRTRLASEQSGEEWRFVAEAQGGFRGRKVLRDREGQGILARLCPQVSCWRLQSGEIRRW